MDQAHRKSPHRIHERLALLATLGLWLGCSYQFSAGSAELPLLGDPPPQSSFQQLNTKPAADSAFVVGADSSYWIAIREFQPPETLSATQVVTALRLSAPAKTEIIQAYHVYIVWWAFYLVQPNIDPNQPTTLTLHSAGATTPDEVYSFPSGSEYLQPGAGGADFLYWVQSPTTTTFDVVHRNPLVDRKLPVPPGVDPQDPTGAGEFFFDGTGDLLFTRDGNGLVVAHSTLMDVDTTLGILPPYPIVDDGHKFLLTCGDDGLRTTSFDGKQTKVLDPDPCNPSGTAYDGTTVLYLVGNQVRTVPVNGSQPPTVVMMDPAKRLLWVGPNNVILYSRDPSNEYIYGAGDGWLNDWQFMNRGLLGYSPFSSDMTRLRWVDNAADDLGVGDLESALVPNGSPLLLARNVPWYQFEELDDGRVLAVANSAYPGPFNRIIVIDEKAMQSRWVANAASSYDHIPLSTDLLVSSPIDAGGVNLFRVPVPPKGQ